MKRILILTLLLSNCGGGNNPPPPTTTTIPPIVFKPLVRLVPNGTFFRLEDGTKYTIIRADSFQLYQRYLAGENLDLVVNQLHDAGFNSLRIASMCFHKNTETNNLEPCPIDFSAPYYNRLIPFSHYLNDKGFYWEFTVFWNVNPLMNDASKQHSHWDSICSELKNETNVMIELVNERDVASQSLDVNQFDPCINIISSHGSNGSQAPPVRPWWNYETMHFNDAFEWWRKIGHNSMEFSQGTDGIVASHVPVIADENTRAPNFDTNKAYDASASAALLTAGSTYHFDHGRYSELMDDNELILANSWTAGARSVPLDCQDGGYKLRNDLLTNDLLRVYQRGDSPDCIVRIRR